MTLAWPRRDGSAVALIRGGMVWHASNYSDNTTWAAVVGDTGQSQSPHWPTGVEDPYVWVDGGGVFHALAHAFSPFCKPLKTASAPSVHYPSTVLLTPPLRCRQTVSTRTSTRKTSPPTGRPSS